MCHKKRKLKFPRWKHCLETARIENKINHLENNNIDADSLKEFIKSEKTWKVLKLQKRFKREGHNVFTEEINNTDLNSYDDRKFNQLIR